LVGGYPFQERSKGGCPKSISTNEVVQKKKKQIDDATVADSNKRRTRSNLETAKTLQVYTIQSSNMCYDNQMSNV
jgi:hypothetical protein